MIEEREARQDRFEDAAPAAHGMPDHVPGALAFGRVHPGAPRRVAERGAEQLGG